MITVAHLFYMLNMPWDNDPMIIKEDFNKILLNEENKKLFLKNYLTPKEYNYKERSVRFSRKEVILANTYFMSLPCYKFKSLESKELANNVCLVLKCIKNRKGMKFEFMIHWKLQNMHGKNGESRTLYNDFTFDVDQRTITIENNKKHYPENKKVLDVEIREHNCTRNSFYLSGGKEFFYLVFARIS